MKRFLLALLLSALLMSFAAAAFAQEVELHGFMQNRFYANPDSPSRFVTERVSLSAVGRWENDVTGYVEVYYNPWLTDRAIQAPPGPGVAGYTADQFRVYLESAYVDLPSGPGRLRIGKGRQLNFGLMPTYPNRKTSQYGIVAETFTQDRIIGAQYDIKRGAFDVGASLYTDLRVQNRKAGDFAGAPVNGLMPSSKVVAHIVDKDDPANNPGTLAGSVRFGITKPDYQVHLSGATGKMVNDDVEVLNTAFGADSTSRAHNKYGLDASYTWGPFCLQSEVYQGNFSFLKITGYQVLAGYQPKDKTRFYMRWSALSNNKPINNATNNRQLTWPTKQFTIGVIQPIRKGIWVEADYEKNMESTGGWAKSKNDIFFIEVFTGF